MSDNKLKLIPNSVDNVAKNLTDLPTKNIGQTLSDCWFLVFGGISQLAEKRRTKYSVELEKFKKELQTSLENVPNDKKHEPTTQIVMSALDDVKYCIEEKELRELFVSLITSSTNVSKTVHPSFSHIIRQMSIIDAKLLKLFKAYTNLPICNIKSVIPNNSGFTYVAQNIFIDGPKNISEEAKSVSVSSLSHLGILEIPDDQFITDESVYEPFEKSLSYLQAQHNTSHTIELEKKLVRLTPLGKLFVSCCIPD